MIRKILYTRTFHIIGGIALIYTGLGFMGIIGHYIISDKIVAYIFGIVFFINGIFFLSGVHLKRMKIRRKERNNQL